MASPNILALDFDGVICDGLQEYFLTAWAAYREVFGPSEVQPPAGLAEKFYPLRPVVETGWEMPLVLYALESGLGEDIVLNRWPELIPQLLAQAKVEASDIAQSVDEVRDRWIRRDLKGWLSYQRFYPGVIDRLQRAIAAGVELVIISTKEGRFIQQLLEQGGIQLAHDRVFGKEVKQPKYATLRQLKLAKPNASIWFVEDRVKALQSVQTQSDLDDVGLFLASWGYNTAADRALASPESRIYGLDLPQFCGSFDGWGAATGAAE